MSDRTLPTTTPNGKPLDPQDLQRATERAYEPCSDFFWLLRKMYHWKDSTDNEVPIFVIGEIGGILIEEAQRRLPLEFERLERQRQKP